MFSLLCSCLLVIPTKAILYTSVFHMYGALHAEKDMAQLMKDYIRARDKDTNLDKLSRIADKMEAHSSKALTDPVYYIATPNGAFQFIKRFALDWNREIDVVLNEMGATETRRAELRSLRRHLPSLVDLKGIANSIYLLQDSYGLNSSSLAKGYISGKRAPPLTADDCLQLGILAFDVAKFYHSYRWMKTALDLEQTEENKTVSRLEILGHCIKVCEYKNKFGLALELTEEQLKLDPTLKQALERKKFYKEKLKNEPDSSQVYKDFELYKTSDVETFYEYCRNETILQVKDQHRLKCRYHSNSNHPLLVLNPVKEEELYLSPKISLYHDVVSEEELSEFKRQAVPYISKTTQRSSCLDFQISKVAFIPSSASPTLTNINKRTAAIAGLVVDQSVKWHAANYGLGGYFPGHRDTSPKGETVIYSDRIATWLFYLGDVEAGGHTVFPFYGLKIFPEKRAAAIWYNFHLNGSSVKDSYHFACPVLVGSKWVSTSWIDIIDQTFTRPCSTNRYK